MLKTIKVTIKDTIIYGLGNIAVKVVGFILIPLYTNPRYFLVDDFGVLGVLEISSLVLTAILASSLPQSLTRWYWDKNHISSQKSIFFMSFATQVVISLVLCGLLFPLSGKLSMLLFSGKTDWTKVIGFLIVSSGLQAINNIVNTLMRLQSRSLLYTITNISKLIIVLSLTIFLIVSKGMGLEGIYLAQVIGNAVFLIILAGYTFRNSIISFDRRVFADMNVYGFPLLIANISAVLLTVIDRYSLNSLALLKDVAIYSMAFKITSVLKLVIVDSIKLAISPIMIKKIDDPENKRFYSKVLLYTSFVLMSGIIVISLFSLEIIKIISGSKEFWNAVAIIPILALSVFFINMKEVTVYSLHIVKKTRIIGSIVIVTTILSLVLNLILIPLWDITGSAIATIITQLFYWLVILYYSQKYFPVPYEYRKLLTIFVSGAIISFSALLINDFSLLPRLLIKSMLVISFPAILYLFNFYETAELNAIGGFVKKWSNIKNLKGNLLSILSMNDDINRL